MLPVLSGVAQQIGLKLGLDLIKIITSAAESGKSHACVGNSTLLEQDNLLAKNDEETRQWYEHVVKM